MTIKSCLMKNDMALTGAAVKAHPPASSSTQKLVEKQEKMYHSLSKDAGFQKDIVGLKRMDKITAIQKKYANNGVNISRKKINQMMKSGVTVAKPPPIVMPKPPPVAPEVTKPPPIIPKPPPKIVSVPKEPVPKVVPVKPIPKGLLAEFKEAKTLDEALGEWGKYGHGNPMTGNFTKDWSAKKKLETMNRMNAQMNDMQKWIRGRKLGGVGFDDGDQKWNGKSIQNTGMGFNKITLNHRNSFKKYGYGEKSAGALRKSWFNVSEGNASITLRHETGHALWFDSPSANLRIEFTNRYKVLKKAVIEENVSKYAAKNAKEFFAESFAKYSSPKYKMGSLNKAFGNGFEELMEKILVSDRKPLQVAKPLAKIVKLPTMPKPVLAEFKAAKTLEKATEEYRKYGLNNPMASEFAKDWDKAKQLKTMNEINAQMHGMSKWTHGRRLGKLDFKDGDKEWGGMASASGKMSKNHLSLNYREKFLKYGSGESSYGKCLPYRTSVSSGNLSVTLRHEMGHTMWGEAATISKNDFTKVFETLKRPLIEKNVSKYASTNAKEFFSETFAIYSSPKYKAGALNKVFGNGFEELMEKILIGGS